MSALICYNCCNLESCTQLERRSTLINFTCTDQFHLRPPISLAPNVFTCAHHFHFHPPIFTCAQHFHLRPTFSLAPKIDCVSIQQKKYAQGLVIASNMVKSCAQLIYLCPDLDIYCPRYQNSSTTWRLCPADFIWCDEWSLTLKFQ